MIMSRTAPFSPPTNTPNKVWKQDMYLRKHRTDKLCQLFLSRDTWCIFLRLLPPPLSFLFTWALWLCSVASFGLGVYPTRPKNGVLFTIWGTRPGYQEPSILTRMANHTKIFSTSRLRTTTLKAIGGSLLGVELRCKFNRRGVNAFYGMKISRRTRIRLHFKFLGLFTFLW